MYAIRNRSQNMNQNINNNINSNSSPNPTNQNSCESVIYPETLNDILKLLSSDEILELLNNLCNSSSEISNLMLSKVENHQCRRKLFVRSLNYKTTSKTLYEIFSLYGEIEEAAVIYDIHNQRSKGYGFVTYINATSAKNALAQPLKEIDGRLTETIVAARGRHLMSLGLLDVGQPPSAHIKSLPPVVMTTPIMQQYGMRPCQNQSNMNQNMNQLNIQQQNFDSRDVSPSYDIRNSKNMQSNIPNFHHHPAHYQNQQYYESQQQLQQQSRSIHHLNLIDGSMSQNNMTPYPQAPNYMNMPNSNFQSLTPTMQYANNNRMQFVTTNNNNNTQNQHLNFTHYSAASNSLSLNVSTSMHSNSSCLDPVSFSSYQNLVSNQMHSSPLSEQSHPYSRSLSTISQSTTDYSSSGGSSNGYTSDISSLSSLSLSATPVGLPRILNENNRATSDETINRNPIKH